MRINAMRLLVVGAAALGLAGAAASAAAAPGPAMTYHGTFSGAVVYEGCDSAVQPATATGTWNVTLRSEKDATMTFNILTNGRHHVAYGTKGVPSDAPPGTFQIHTLTGAGQLVVSLVGDQLTYEIAPYHYGIDCASVTYFGTL